MSLDEQIKKYGAKAANLDYIRSQYVKNNESEIPIEPYVMVPVGEDWRDYQHEISKLENCLVRSSSPLEDGKNASFAGLFWTAKNLNVYNPVEMVLDSVNDEDVLRYAEINGITDPIEMALLFHKNSDSDSKWGIMRHPHQENLVFMMGRPSDRGGLFDWVTDNYVYDENTKELRDIVGFCSLRVYKERFGKKEESDELPEYLKEALDHYKKIENFPKFKDNYVYHMEFGTHPFSIYQFRPFREKQKSDWKLDLDEKKKLMWKDEKSSVSGFGISFGITPPEGIELTLARAIASNKSQKHIERYRKNLAQLPYKRIVTALLKGWDLSPMERAYAEEVAKIDPNVHGANESEAFDNAIKKISSQMKDSENCILRENMHFNFGKGVDLTFPNAKAYIADGGVQILSHEWIRPMQHYDVVLADYTSIVGKTGDKIRVFSDGNLGAVVEEIKY